jgi:hypothetical protein
MRTGRKEIVEGLNPFISPGSHGEEGNAESRHLLFSKAAGHGIQ